MGNNTTPIAWTIPKNNTPTINISGLDGGSSKTNWGEVAGGVGGAIIGTVFEVLAAKKNSGSQTVETTPEQQVQQQLYNEVVGYARNMDVGSIQAKISEIDGSITNLTTELGKQQELALGDQSQAYKDNETKMKDMEEKYGFGADTPGKDATKEAKQGDAYQKACDKYNTLLDQDTKQKAKANQLSNQISNISTQIQDIGNSITNGENQLSELNTSLSSATNDKQKQNIQDQIKLKEAELSKLKTQKSTLEQNKINLEGEQAKNNAAAIKQEDIDKAKAEMEALAQPEGANGTDYEAEYKTYQGLKEQNRQLKAGASAAKREAERIDLEIKSLELEKAKYEDALEIKKEIVSDDTEAANKFDDVSAKDGNWLTRTFGWGKKGKAQREARADRNNFIQEYMANHGVSKKEAKEALEDLSGMNDAKNKAENFCNSNTYYKNMTKIATKFCETKPQATDAEIKAYLDEIIKKENQ